MKPIFRRTLVLSSLVVIFIGGFLMYQFFAAAEFRKVPREFSEARVRGALISQEIVAASSQVAVDLARINEENPSYNSASSTVIGFAVKAEEIRLQALELTKELGIMAEALDEISSSEASLAALEAISDRLDLVSSLVRYTERLKLLSEALRLNMQKGVRNEDDIRQLIQDLNNEVATINALNLKANGNIERFDALLR